MHSSCATQLDEDVWAEMQVSEILKTITHNSLVSLEILQLKGFLFKCKGK
jgi:hypothetical protein